MIFGTLTVNKIQVLGTDIKNESGFNSYIANIISIFIKIKTLYTFFNNIFKSLEFLFIH